MPLTTASQCWFQMLNSGAHSQSKISLEKYQQTRNARTNAIAALRTRSRSSARCCRNGMRPASSSDSWDSAILRDGAGGQLDQEREVLGRVALVVRAGVGLA